MYPRVVRSGRVRTAVQVTALLFAVAACSGSTDSPAATVAVAPTAPAVGTSAPATGGGVGGALTVTVTLTGGEDAGAYEVGGNPYCSKGLIGPDGWGVQYSVLESPPDTVSSLQLVAPAAGEEDSENSMFRGISFKMTVTVGGLLDGTAYDITVRTDGGDSAGAGSATIDDRGATAVIQARGTTADGVGIEATVNCPSVTRA